MDYVYLSTFFAIVGTLFMLLIYIYLYSLYKEKYMGTWAVGWLIHFIRIALFESGLLDYKHSPLGCLVYQTLFILCALALVYSARLVINKHLSKYWLYGFSLTFILCVFSNLVESSVFCRLIPPTLFSGIALFYIGNIFINKVKIKGVGNSVTGWAFILWGLLTSIIPYFSVNTTYLQWITMLCGISRLIIASSIILVYFEKTTLELHAKETYFRGLADNSADIIYHYKIHPEKKVEYASPSIYLITGYSQEEFYNNPILFQSILHPDDLSAYETYINKPVWTKDVPFEYRLIHKDKKTIHVEQTFMTVYDKDGTIAGRQGIIRDVTARNHIKEAENMYDRLYMVGKTAVSIAHHIRNPLTTIKGYLQMFHKKNNCENITLMLEEVDHANSMLSEYMLLSDEKKTNFKYCLLNNIINEVILISKPYAKGANIEIKTELADLPLLELDEEEIRYMLVNLIRNGIEAMPGGGELLLNTQISNKKTGESEVILSIRDTGQGMPGNIVKNFGTPFLTTKNMGIGLGLPICYRIASRNRANIYIDTTNEGTTFKIHFSILNLSL